MLQDFDSGVRRQQESNVAAAQTAALSEPGSPHSFTSSHPDPAGGSCDVGGPTRGPAALAASTDSCTLLVSFDEPPAAAATLHNVLFRTVEITSFVLACTKSAVRPTTARMAASGPFSQAVGVLHRIPEHTAACGNHSTGRETIQAMRARSWQGGRRQVCGTPTRGTRGAATAPDAAPSWRAGTRT